MTEHSKHTKNSRVEPFSLTLHRWLSEHPDSTLSGLNKVFAEKSFAILFLLLLALPALPIPTGGLTHVTELIAALICLELIAGRRAVWLPKRWAKLDARKIMKPAATNKLISVIRWFEKISRRRLGELLKMRPVLSVLGLIILTFTVAAFVAPPFSGLDTLPALGVVVISLAMILEDFIIVVIGILIGVVGIAIEVTAGAALYQGLTHLF